MYTIVKGDLLEQNTEVIVNSWNRNIIPWWLLLPQGVSGAIKKQGGTAPFKELSKIGIMPLGSARLTGPGKLRYKGIIHVAGINMAWIATEYSVRESVKNALALSERHKFKSLGFPLIGSGSGNRGKEWSKSVMIEQLEKYKGEMEIIVVEYG